MKFLSYILIAIISAASTKTTVMGQDIARQDSKNQKVKPAKSLRHVVFFKFKESSSQEDIESVIKAFSDLPGKINTILGYEWGTNISPENLAQGYTHCFLVTFKNAAGRDYYLPHPAHKEFGKILGPHLDKVLVIDFENGK